MKIGLRVRGLRQLRSHVRVLVVLAVSGATLASVAPASAEGPPAPVGPSSLSPTSLRVDTLTDPIGLGDTSPGLAWSLSADGPPNSPAAQQTAYEIRVASTAAGLDHPDLWDSGKILSSDTNNIAYGGAPLQSGQGAVWDVRVWDASGRDSAWSASATWEMGLLNQSDWTAKWIEDPDYTYATNGVPNPLPIFGKAFDLHGKVAQARLYATGLGQYTAKLNGAPVSDAVLEPGQTSYWAEVDYRTYDVTRLLQNGSNVLGFEVGSGVYQQADSTPMGRYMFQPGNNKVFGTPKVIAQLAITYADGSRQTIASDSSWLTRSGPTTFSSWWGGEDYDARVMPANWTDSASNLNGAAWHAARPATLTSSTVPSDTTPLVADPRPPVTVAREAHPTITRVTPPADNTTLVAPAGPGATNLKVASVTNLYRGDTVNVDTGAAAESRQVTAVGTAAGPATTLAAAAAAGDTNIKVTSVGRACLPGASCVGTTSFIVGQPLLVDTGTNQEVVTVTAVGTAGATGTGVTFTPALSAAHASGITVRDAGTGVTVTPALSGSHTDGTAVASVPGPTYVLDFGANLSGLVKITSSGVAAGTQVSMVPAEQVNADGTVNVASTGASATSQIRYDYTFAGHGVETWHAQFTYNGLQYLQVRGLPKPPTANTITLLVTHASNKETASFQSSSSMVNTIYAITQRALENNMQSVLTDCPDREKGPYTGDNVQDVQTDLTLFDMQAYEAQLVANMRTSQRPTPVSSASPGLIANIAPEFHAVPAGLFGGHEFLDEPNWADAVILIPWELYQVYGDTKAMSANYDAMVKWLDYEAANKQANGGNIPGLGDWSAAQNTDPQPIIDSGYYRGVDTIAKIAQVLGKTSDAAKYSALATSLAAEYNAKYLHTDSAGNAWYANNTEASNAVALDAGLVPDQYHQAVVNSLVAAVHAFADSIGTGSVALGPLLRQLHAAGRDDLVYQIVTNPTGPSYASLVNQGATTLWESLSGSGGSHDHQFLGDVNAWLVHDVVGIDQATGTRQYRQLLIRPAIVGDLTHAAGSYTTPAGVAAVSWTVATDGSVTMSATVPANTTAEIWVPTGGHPVTAPRGVTFSRFDTFDGSSYAVYTSGPGSYRFTTGG